MNSLTNMNKNNKLSNNDKNTVISNKNVKSNNNGTPTNGDQVYIIPYRNRNKGVFINNDLYTVKSISADGQTYKISKSGKYFGTTTKDLKKGNISPRAGYVNKNGVEIGKEYEETVNRPYKVKPVSRGYIREGNETETKKYVSITKSKATPLGYGPVKLKEILGEKKNKNNM